MFRKLFIIPLVLINIGILAAQDTISLNLQDCLNVATSESPTIKIANKEIKRVEYGKKLAIGNLLPSVNLGLSYSRTLKKQKMFFDFPGMPSNPDGIEVGQDNTFNGATNGFSATLPIFAPGLWASINMSELEMELALENARSSKIELVNEVTKAYFSVLMAQDSYKVLLKTYENSSENNRITEEKYKQGVVSQFESISTGVQLRNIEANLTSAQNGVKIAKLRLKMLMGMDMKMTIQIKGNLKDYESTMFSEALSLDITHIATNSDLRKFDIQSKQLKESLKIQRQSYLPTLSASVNYNVMSMVNDENTFTKNHVWFPTSNFALVLQIPLFQGGKRYFKEKQIKNQISQLQDQRKSIEQGLELQIMSGMNTIEKSLKLLKSNKEAMLQAEKAMTISKKTYEVGVGTYLDVANAELSYMQAGLSYNQAIYDYLSAKADLIKIAGGEI